MKLLIIVLMMASFAAHAQFKNESEVSTVKTSGNTKVQTYLFKTLSKYEKDKATYTFGGHYTYGENRSELSARDWDVNLKYEQTLSDRLSFYLGEIVEGYRFQGVKARYNSDAGLKYFFIKSDPKNFFTELGYRYTIEDRYDLATSYENKARAFVEWNHKTSETFQYRLWAEYVPNFTIDNDYLLTYEGSATSIINSVFSLKVSYKTIRRNVPVSDTFKKEDSLFTTSLVAKF